MDIPAIPGESFEVRRKLHLAPFAGICAIMAYIWILTSGLYDTPVSRLPLMTIGLIATLLTIMDIRIGLSLLIFAVGISPEFQLQGVSNLRIEDFLFPIILISWLIRFAARNERFAPTNLKVPILLTVLLSVVSSIFNTAYSETGDISMCLFRLTKSIEYFLIFTITLNSIRREEDLRRFIYLMQVVSVLVGIYGLFQALPANSRVTGPSGETANILGGYYVFHICIAIGLLTNPVKYRLALALGIILMLAPLMNTYARTSYVALFVGILAMLALRRNIWIGLIALACVLSVFATSAISERFMTILSIFQGEIPSSLESRVEGTKLMLGYLPESPILGHGIGILALGAFDNESLRQIYELGILGLLLFLWMIVRILKTSLRLSRTLADPTFQGFAFGCFGATVALFVHSLGATTFTTIRTAESFFFGMGLLYSIAAKVPSRTSGEIEVLEELPSDLPELPRRQ